MEFDDLTEEQKEKVRACKTPEEMAALAEEGAPRFPSTSWMRQAEVDLVLASAIIMGTRMDAAAENAIPCSEWLSAVGRGPAA